VRASVCCRSTSEISRFFFDTINWYRAPSMRKPRSSGCTTARSRFAPNCGLKLVNWLLVVKRFES
jgi:hypothetical protein